MRHELALKRARIFDKSTMKKENTTCKIAIRNAGMKQDDIARVFNVSQSVVSRHFKEHRVAVLETRGPEGPEALT